MKTTIHHKNNFKKWSKIILIHFGILVTISNPAFANDLALGQINHQSNLPEMKAVPEPHNSTLKKPVLESDCDTCAVITESYKKTIEEIIAEDNKIIESEMEDNDASDIERIIREDNQIIESNITNEVFPLDFKNGITSFSGLL